jgi:hypothetical protein
MLVGHYILLAGTLRSLGVPLESGHIARKLDSIGVPLVSEHAEPDTAQ